MLKEKHFYEFERIRIEPEERVITQDGKRLSLSGKAFDLLLVLLRHHGRLVRKEQLISEVWPDAHVGEGNLNVQITAIRKALGNDCIEAVPKQGYRFVADVVERTEELEDDSIKSSKPKRRIWLFAVAAVLVISAGAYLIFHLWARRVRSRSSTTEALYARALEYERLGDDEQALTALEQALALRPDDKPVCLRAAFLAYGLDQLGRANEYLLRCKAVDAADEAIRLKAQGLSEVLADNPTHGLQIYRLLIDRYPDDTDALYRFSELAADLNRLGEAETALHRCLSQEPENRFCSFEWMYLKIKQNQFDDVLRQYDSLPPNVRDYPWFDEPVGIAFFGNGQLEDARQSFIRLRESQQRLHGTTHFTLAEEWLAGLLIYQGRITDAARRIEQIIRTSDNAQIRGNGLSFLAQTYVAVGDDRTAEKLAMKIPKAQPTPAALRRGALVMAALGDSSGTEHFLSLRSKTANRPLSNGDDHLIRGVLAASKGDNVDGIEEIKLAKDLHPRDEEATYQLGVAYFHAGKYQSALKMFQAVLALKGTVLLDNVPLLIPLATYYIAQCNSHLGNTDAAMSAYSELGRIWSRADDDLKQKYVPPDYGRH